MKRDNPPYIDVVFLTTSTEKAIVAKRVYPGDPEYDALVSTHQPKKSSLRKLFNLNPNLNPNLN